MRVEVVVNPLFTNIPCIDQPPDSIEQVILDLYPSCAVTRVMAKSDKKGKRKVQGVPQSQTAAPPRSQEEEETDKSKQAQTEQTYEKHKD